VNARLPFSHRAQALVLAALAAYTVQAAPVWAQLPQGQRPDAGVTTAVPATVRLTLDEAITRAIDTSNRLGEGRARVDAAKAAVDGRSSADKPMLSLNGGYTRTNHVDEFAIQIGGQAARVIYPDIPDNARTRLDLQGAAHTSGRLGALERAATADLDASTRDVDTIRADTRLDANRTFWSLVMATESVHVLEESLKRVEAHLTDVKNMHNLGLSAPNEVLTVEARRSRERMLLIDAQNSRRIAEADLRRVTGVPAGVGLELDLPPTMTNEPLPDVSQLTVEARERRPERQVLQFRIQAIGDRRAAASAAARPTVAVVAGVDYARPNARLFPRTDEWKYTFDVGVNVAWTAWDWGKVRADVAEADANRRAAEQRLADFDRQLEFEITTRVLDVESSRATVVAARDAVTSAAEAHRVVAERFKAGLVTNTEVMDAQVALLQAQLDVTRTMTNVRLAMARLDRALGR
jgi:outer membrane protein